MNEGDHSPTPVIFLFDVDNTLLDNDRVAADLQRHLVSEVGAEGAQEYWRIFEQLRTELGYADYLGALQRYRAKHPRAQQVLCMSDFLINYPFAERVFPDALKAIEHVQQWGPAVILSDGDVVFQPLKISRSGFTNAVSGRVLIYVHKEQELDDVEQRYPAEHYVTGGRQIAYPGCRERILGLACDYGFRQARSLRRRSENPRQLSASGY